jgi:hypothetical protein
METAGYLGNIDTGVEKAEYATFDRSELSLHADSPRGDYCYVSGLLALMRLLRHASRNARLPSVVVRGPRGGRRNA